MPRGDKSKYTSKQQRQAEHIEEGYEKKGVPEKEAERRAWATVNKTTGGGKKPGGSGRGKTEDKGPAKKGGRNGGKAHAGTSAHRKATASTKSRSHSAAAKKRTRTTGKKSSGS